MKHALQKERRSLIAVDFGLLSTYRNAIFGFAALWIVLYHSTNSAMAHIVTLKPPVFHDFAKMGNIGVDVFLFLSGIGLYFSYSKGPRLLDFYKKRLIRVYLPYVVMTLPYIVFVFIKHNIDFALMIKSILTVNFWTGEIKVVDFWYVPVILLFYLLYPVIYRLIYDKRPFTRLSKKLSQDHRELIRTMILIALTVAAGILIYYTSKNLYTIITRIPSRLAVFILGTYCGKRVKEKRPLSPWITIAAIVIFVGAFPLYSHNILKGVWSRCYGSLAGVAMVFLTAQLLMLLSRIRVDRLFAFFGAFSFEIYIMTVIGKHMMIRYDSLMQHPLRNYWLVMAVAILIAWCVSLIEKPVFNKLLSKKKPSGR